MTMACTKDFVKILIDERESYVVRCCAFECSGIYIPIHVSDEMLENETLLRDYLFSKFYEVPKNIHNVVQSEHCHANCIEVFDKESAITTVSLGIKACNLACPTCRKEQTLYISKRTQDIYFKILNALKGHCKILNPNLSGEPFFYKERMRNYINSIQAGDLECFEIVSNMTTMSDIDISCICSLSKRINVKVLASIDSVIEKTFMELRFPSSQQMYKKALENIFKLKTQGVDIRVNLTISDKNASWEELSAFGEYFKSYNIPINAVVAFSDNSQWAHLRDSETVKKFVSTYNVYIRNS